MVSRRPAPPREEQGWEWGKERRSAVTRTCPSSVRVHCYDEIGPPVSRELVTSSQIILWFHSYTALALLLQHTCVLFLYPISLLFNALFPVTTATSYQHESIMSVNWFQTLVRPDQGVHGIVYQNQLVKDDRSIARIAENVHFRNRRWLLL